MSFPFPAIPTTDIKVEANTNMEMILIADVGLGLL